MNTARIETAEVARAMGSILRDRNTWRHHYNRIRVLLDLPALTTQACETEDGDATYEQARMCKRDSDHLFDVVQRLKERDNTVERLNEQSRVDRGRLRAMADRINELEARIINLGGEP